ncbi:phosphoglucosamine mutase [Meiothermus granaticius]|uniref:Phosphoglucosamine mutase n=1 Tax=Meiothermus granaticius NBRC 107808 TaxID=1227551 RepID=A0A399F9T4_9DEIN|nr:phosphoglucosamine mutase [Meiothermus granaticius]RIH91672.1 Phosphoglucosamine mutase [Meiothermus granaticius NBRC 107808]GEM86092.1 phosphoglucosamine mutase [Meiothermus granaticius NBRC 107808]
MERRYFGTDGVRGIAGEPPLTPEFVLKLGQAAGAYFRAHAKRPVVLLGKDTRQSCDLLEAALAAGLMSQGVRVEHLSVLPTPGVAHLTRTLGATAGVMISASHNPYTDNGIKFFSADGDKLPDAVEAEIEGLLGREFSTEGMGTVSDFSEAERMYLDFLLSKGESLEGLRIALDTANGATYRLAHRLFQGLGAEVFVLFNTPDGRNINRGCGSTHPQALQKQVVDGGFDLGAAFDGDGDRVILVDRKGREFHGDHMLYLNAMVRHEPGVVGTLMSNMGLEVRLREAGINFFRTAVGDRYVYEKLRSSGLSLGGEQSGHVLFLDHAPTGDGMLTAILTLKALRESGRDLSEWYDALPMYPQLLKNVRVRDKAALMKSPQLQAAIAQTEAQLSGQGRVNVRPSGTESLVRVMVEGPAGLIESVSAELVNLVEQLDKALA